MDPGTTLGLAGLGLSVLGITAYRLFPKVPKWIDVLGFIIGVALLGAALVGSWLHVFAGHRLEWISDKSAPIALINGGQWPSALVFIAVIFAGAWMSTQIALRAMIALPSQQQPQNPQGSGRSAESILDFISGVRKLPTPIPIKITSIEEWMPFSKVIAKALRTADLQVLENAAAADFVFPATTKHSKIIIRYRTNNPFGLGVWLGMAALASPCEFEEFPDTDVYNFVQIEIGGRP